MSDNTNDTSKNVLDDELTPLERFKRGDSSVDTIQKVLTEVYVTKAKTNRGLTRLRDNKTGKQIYKDTGSQQLSGDPFREMAAGEYLEPQYDPETWAATVENNTRLGRSIRTYSRNTVGLGWNIETTIKVTQDTSDEVKEEIDRQIKALTRIFSSPNDEMPSTSLFYNMKVDEESTGNGYIEVVRNPLGIITSLYHVPAISMRKRVLSDDNGEREVKGFVQIQGTEKVYFKEFGDLQPMSASTGKYFNGDDIDAADLATEIIHFRLYTPMNHWYGAPRYVSASPAILGNRYAAIRNVKFFENDAVPRMAILVSGGKLGAEVCQQIEEFFKGKSMGNEKSHNTIVIQSEEQKIGFDKGNAGPSIDLKPLTVGVTEDASFQTYREANDEEIRECFGIGQVFFASDTTNRASAATSREITNEQEFEPDRLEKEYIINQKLVPAILQEEPDRILVRFRFERMKLTDPLDVARLDQTYASLGALTPNELRISLGKDPFPSDYAFANKPMQVAMAQMTMHQSEAVKKDWENELSYNNMMQQAQQQNQQQQPGQYNQNPQMPMGQDNFADMGIGGLFAGLGDEQGEAQEEKDINAENGGMSHNSYGNIELMKTLSRLTPEKRQYILTIINGLT